MITAMYDMRAKSSLTTRTDEKPMNMGCKWTELDELILTTDVIRAALIQYP